MNRNVDTFIRNMGWVDEEIEPRKDLHIPKNR